MSQLFEDLKESTEDMNKHLKGETVEITLNRIKIHPVEAKTSKDVKKFREDFRISQGVLAQILGVERKTIEAWESGGQASKPASRIMEMIETRKDLLNLFVVQSVT